MTIKEIKEMAKQEAEKLREHATPEELNNLDILSFDATDYNSCIYGQITGDCFSSRAKQLITKCAPKILSGFIGKPQKLEPVAKKFASRRSYLFDYWSPIEAAIAHNKLNDLDHKNENLIKYLKGERKTLAL